jgi:hypothetical protein
MMVQVSLLFLGTWLQIRLRGDRCCFRCSQLPDGLDAVLWESPQDEDDSSEDGSMLEGLENRFL